MKVPHLKKMNLREYVQDTYFFFPLSYLKMDMFHPFLCDSLCSNCK